MTGWLQHSDENSAAQRFGQDVVNAARQWQARHIRPGQDDPEYLAAVEKRVEMAQDDNSSVGKALNAEKSTEEEKDRANQYWEWK